MVQYGQKPQRDAPRTAGYEQIDPAQPKTKQPDPSPPAQTVIAFHRNAPVDSRPEDIHHTLGPESNQAARGSHRHNGSDSPLLLEGVTITGSKGGNAAVASIISALVRLGATDSTT